MRDSKQSVLDFWFNETEPRQWFEKNDTFDQIIRDRFGGVYDMAAKGLCASWQDSADGALALCIILDQFPRNMFRDDPQAFATDGQAVLISKQAIKKGLDQVLTPTKRRFIYLPFEHSENLQDQIRSVELFATMKYDDPLGYDYAVRHKDVIERFGRFPHRNAVLGRASTEEEKEYLAADGGF